MARLMMSLVLFALFALMQAGNTADAQEKGKLKGFLPQGWKKLGLTEKQTQDVYAAQAKYKAKIDDLEAKIDALKAERDADLKKILTADQKKALAGEKTEEMKKDK